MQVIGVEIEKDLRAPSFRLRGLLPFISCLSIVLAGCSGSDYPDSQQTFIGWHNGAIDRYSDARNELQYKEIWERREKGICERLPQGELSNWVGVVEGINRNLIDTEESAFVDIRIYERKAFLLFTSAAINLKTHVGSVADALAAIRLGVNPETAIIKGTPLYGQIFNLEEGDEVQFSGQLLKDKVPGACFYEFSFGMNGKIRWPEYLVRFTSIEKLSSASKSDTAKEVKADTSKPDPIPAEQEACFDEKLKVFRKDMGDEAVPKVDVLEQWDTECSVKAK